MLRSRTLLAITLTCTMPACGSTTGSSPPGGDGTGSGGGASGGTSAGGASGSSGEAGGSGAVGQGGSVGAGGSTAPAKGGTAGTPGAGGSVQGGSGGSGPTGVDLSGTWISDVKTTGTESLPFITTVSANIEFVFRLVLTSAGDTLNVRLDICRLTAVSTPDPTALGVTFTPAVIATMTTTGSEGTPVVNVGDPIPLPAFTMLSGITGSGTAVDADSDSHPGVTVPGTTWNNTSVNAYVGLTIQTSLSPTLSAQDSMSGTASFDCAGKIFGSDNALLTSGDISVAPDSKTIPFTAKRLAGDVPCSDVLKALP